MSAPTRLADYASERVRPLKRVEYEKLVADGSLDDERVELLGGVIVEMSPQNSRHAAVIQRLTRTLDRAVGSLAGVRVQLPFAAADDSLPEPDIAVVPPGDFDEGHPGSAYLLVEVASSSRRRDTGLKAEIYTRAGVPEYWVADPMQRVILVHTAPDVVAGAYTRVTASHPGESLRLRALPDVEITVSDILG
jgi:Uma2 family endonuclease